MMMVMVMVMVVLGGSGRSVEGGEVCVLERDGDVERATYALQEALDRCWHVVLPEGDHTTNAVNVSSNTRITVPKGTTWYASPSLSAFPLVDALPSYPLSTGHNSQVRVVWCDCGGGGIVVCCGEVWCGVWGCGGWDRGGMGSWMWGGIVVW